MRKLKHEEIPRPDPLRVQTLPKHPIRAVLDNVRSLHNVGSMFRTSDAAAVEHLYLTGITGTPDNPALRKTALGAQNTVAWSHEADARSVVRSLHAQGHTIAVLEITDTPTDIDSLQARHFPLCLVVGNEISGVNDEVLDLADMAFEIPQFGAKQSLNVSVAYGIALYDILRVYHRLFGPPVD
ncbi:MAG TPA: TrmH family RNA methyltransferase [Rhodothermales bacterium]|nr:TrmH family RNA methyltransferase [Rhodothermales bacterium]